MLSRAGLADWCVVMYGLVIRGTDHYVKKAQSLFALIKFLHFASQSEFHGSTMAV